MSAYDHPPEYPEDEEGFDPFEEEEVERRNEQRAHDRARRDEEREFDRDLERDTIDRVNEGGGP